MPQEWGVWDREFVASHHGGDWQVTDILAPKPVEDATA